MEEVQKALVLTHSEDEPPAVCAGTPQLVPIANKPLLIHGLERFRDAGIRTVGLLVGGPGTDEIRDAVGSGRRWGLDVEYIESPSGAGGVRGLMDAAQLDGVLSPEGMTQPGIPGRQT